MPQSQHQRSLLNDHHNIYNNNEKGWNIERIANMWCRDMKLANAFGKMVPIDLLKAGLWHIFTLKKKSNLCEKQKSKEQ